MVGNYPLQVHGTDHDDCLPVVYHISVVRIISAATSTHRAGRSCMRMLNQLGLVELHENSIYIGYFMERSAHVDRWIGPALPGDVYMSTFF